MRAVTFSTPQIQNAINQNFVALYTNTEGDPTAGTSIRHRPNDAPGPCIRGNGQQNVQTIFMTPDLEILHVATGFIGPEDLYKEMQFAANLYAELPDDSANRHRTVRNAHVTRLEQAGFRDQEINAGNDMEAMQAMITGMGNPATLMSGPATGNNDRAGQSNVFAPMIRQGFLSDNRFSIRHPLMALRELESDPGELVGRGKTFFGSQGSSSNSNRN